MGDYNTLKSFRRPHHCDPHLDQTKLYDLLPLTIDGVLISVIIADFTFWKIVSGRTWRRSTAVRASLSVSRAVSVEDGT